MKQTSRLCVFASLFLLLPAVQPSSRLAAQTGTIAITGGTVYPVSGPRIANGTVVIQNGRITAVGANVAVPAGALRVDATGKWITPGFIHASANAGLGVAGLGGQQEGGVQGDVNPSFNPAEGIDPAAIGIPIPYTFVDTHEIGIGVAAGVLLQLHGDLISAFQLGDRVFPAAIKRSGVRAVTDHPLAAFVRSQMNFPRRSIESIDLREELILIQLKRRSAD